MSQLVSQNPWWRNASNIERDRHIILITESEVAWTPRIKHYIDLDSKLIFTLRGPRQVGKTTLVKLFIKGLLENEIEPRRIFYWTCDLIESPQKLVEIIQQYLGFSRRHENEIRYIFLDEISAIKDWQRGIKYLYDTGELENVTVLMTGSHNLDIRKAAERLPGRRGPNARSVDKILLPMKFAEYIETRSEYLSGKIRYLDLLSFQRRRSLVEQLAKGQIPDEITELMMDFSEIQILFDEYLLTGGVITAINDYVELGYIRPETYSTYVQATIGDMMRWNKRETYLAQLIRRIIDSLGSQVSWRALQKNTDIGSQNTVAEYIDVLKSSFVLTPVYVIDRNKKMPNYGMDKKINFHDPFIFHSLNGWVKQSPYHQEALNFLNSDKKPIFVESVVADHLIRFAFALNPIDEFEPTMHVMYSKDKKSEVDFILKFDDSYIPIEVKYRSSFNRRDINGLYNFTKSQKEYSGIVLTHDLLSAEKDVTAIPTSLFLCLC